MDLVNQTKARTFAFDDDNHWRYDANGELTDMFASCFAESASEYPTPEEWIKTAAPFLLKIIPATADAHSPFPADPLEQNSNRSRVKEVHPQMKRISANRKSQGRGGSPSGPKPQARMRRFGSPPLDM
jgi:hypothetical protein